MKEETKNRVMVALIGSVSAVAVASITTFGAKTSVDKASETALDEVNKSKISNLPVGTIVPSMLSPVRFMEAVGDSDRAVGEREWVLADGRKIEGSDYARLVDEPRAPDLRDMFLRGWNDRRNAGGTQDDAIGAHEHRSPVGYYGQEFEPKRNASHFSTGVVCNKGDAACGRYMSRRRFTEGFWVGGKEVKNPTETRPKNIAVYFYIKIREAKSRTLALSRF